MKTVNLESWTDFSTQIAEIRAELGTRVVELGDERKEVPNDIVFRGQPDSEWELKTTLERTTSATYSVKKYLQRANSVVNEIESVTGTKWHLPPYPEIVEEITTRQEVFCPYLPHYEYLVYLRHHGFPSPLLDWTRSPYIAAYFAMEQASTAERCSVFAFIERPVGIKTAGRHDTIITSMGPYITTDTRHFAQKASYTIATQWDDNTKAHYFRSHQAVTRRSICKQDVLIKITIPRTDRESALKQLEDYNINHYTLFRSEDSLIRSLGLRAFELDGG